MNEALKGLFNDEVRSFDFVRECEQRKAWALDSFFGSTLVAWFKMTSSNLSVRQTCFIFIIYVLCIYNINKG